MKIYLAGKVPKGDEEKKTFKDWKSRYKRVVQKYFDAEIVDPFDDRLDESDFLGLVGHDCQKLKESDLIVFYVEEAMSVGSAQEMVIAKYLKKPVVTVLPKDTEHRRSNLVFHGQLIKDWIHPFIFTFSDFIIEDIEEIGKIKDEILHVKVKNISVIDEAIEYFKSKKS